jgi:hypothetical protein
MAHVTTHPPPIDRRPRGVLAHLLRRPARRHDAIRTGIPHEEEPWGWSCGFYPGSHPGECTNGVAATFDLARADFEAAWQVFLSKRTEADFQASRHQRDWTERKHAMWKAGGKLASQKPSSLMRCPCGEVLDSPPPRAHRYPRSPRHCRISMTADWSRKFDSPIPLPKGRQLVTLKDAGTHITKLPKSEHNAAEW